jgi:murein L,D-transpeptidase YcbB/YkuD
MTRVRGTTIAICGAGLCLAVVLRGQSVSDEIQRSLARELASRPPPAGGISLGGRSLTAWALARRFYADRQNQPAWIAAQDGRSEIRALATALERAAEHGLAPGDYPTATLHGLLAAPDTQPDSLAALDVTATFAFFLFGSELAQGRVVPASVDTMWSAAPRRVDLVAELAAALDSGRVAATIERLAPPQPGAVRLRAARGRYRDIEGRGGWSQVPAGPPLSLGATGIRVEALRHRLAATGDLTAVGGDVFDAIVQDAVERTQASYGLEMDGVVGPMTLAALNVPVADRIQQLELNLERWRWLPAELGDRYIAVNAAAFTLQVVEAGCTVLVAPVIAGRVDWPTPITSGTLTDVAFNPRWNIPRSIAVREMLPIVRRDPGYLARVGIHVMSDATDQAVELDAAAISWNAVVDSSFGYRLWQESGPENPLGRVRFGVSNRFGVALHDTPNQESFTPRQRGFSHGCVRVAGAQELAAYVLGPTPGWGENAADSVLGILSQPGERRVPVPQPVPVYLNYWTAWVDDDGAVQFRPDVYGWDSELAAALRGASRDRGSSATRSTPRS